MCTAAQTNSPSRAAAILAHEMFQHFGVQIGSDKLEEWVKTRWHLIAPLAHDIHGSKMPAELCKDDPAEFRGKAVKAIRLLTGASHA